MSPRRAEPLAPPPRDRPGDDRPTIEPHWLAEQRSLAYHRVIAGRLASDPRILAAAREVLAGWLECGLAGPPARRPAEAEAWQEVLDRPPEEIAQVLGDPGERPRALRQSTPFATQPAGVLEPRERWAIWQAVRDEEEARVAAGTADPRATRHQALGSA